MKKILKTFIPIIGLCISSTSIESAGLLDEESLKEITDTMQVSLIEDFCTPDLMMCYGLTKKSCKTEVITALNKCAIDSAEDIEMISEIKDLVYLIPSCTVSDVISNHISTYTKNKSTESCKKALGE